MFLRCSASGQVVAAGKFVVRATIIMVSLEKLLGAGIAILVLAAACSQAPVGAAERTVFGTERPNSLSPLLSDLERRLFIEIHDGRFGRFSLLEAGLIAGGIDCDRELKSYRHRFDSLAESLRSSGKVHGAPRDRAQAIFEYLHSKLLYGGYSLQASDLRQAFDCGRFNCVSATLLLNCLAQRFGLKAAAVELPGHALSRLELPGETLEIETTCAEWFSVSGNRRVSDTRPPRRLNDVELVATIYYNRGVDLLAERRFADAVAANAKAVRLDPNNAIAKGNYLATINNWGIELAVSGQYAKAAELFRVGMAADPKFEAFRTNYARLLRQWDAAEHEKQDSN